MRLAKKRTPFLALTLAISASVASAIPSNPFDVTTRVITHVDESALDSTPRFALHLERSFDVCRFELCSPESRVRGFDFTFEAQPQANPWFEPEIAVGDGKTGLLYARNRWIDPELGRFISPDPMGYIDGPNGYQFGLNDPTNNSDPLGLEVADGVQFRKDCEYAGKDTATCGRDQSLAMAGTGVGIAESGASLAWNLLTFQVQAFWNAFDQLGSLVSAFSQGGVGEVLIVAEGTSATQRGAALRLIPGVNTAQEASKISSALEQGGSFEGGRQLGRSLFSLGTDIATVYGLGKAASLTAAEIPTVSRGAQLRAQYSEVYPEYLRFRSQGRPPREAAKLAEAYDNGMRMGHHSPIPRRVAVRLRLAESLRDSSLNVVKPPGINIGRFYELHYRLDPRFHGAALGRGMRPWNGAELGLERFGLLKRSWYGTSVPLKATVGGATAGGALWWLLDD